jgi:RNA polymerase sigma-70 factor (sigma-E family)
MVNDEAFIAFVNARYRALVRFGVLLTGTLDAAEELAQSALVQVYPRRRSIAESAEGYVHRTMVHLYWRSSGSSRRHELPVEQVPEIESPDQYAVVGDRAALREALDALPPPQRVVVVLRYWLQMSETEIAAELGCSVGTVKSRASRALVALRRSSAIDSITGKD